MPFKALATQQPWAALIAAGRKTIEVRSWKTHYRGPLVIVASSKRDVDSGHGEVPQPVSCLMAIVDLVDVRPGRSSDTRAAFCNPTGLFSWVLANPRRLREVRYTRSRLMTFDLEPEVRVELAESGGRELAMEWTDEERKRFAADVTTPAPRALKVRPAPRKTLDIGWLIAVPDDVAKATYDVGAVIAINVAATGVTISPRQPAVLITRSNTVAGIVMIRTAKASRRGFQVNGELTWSPGSAIVPLEKMLRLAQVDVLMPDARHAIAITGPELGRLLKAARATSA
jgi:hypothetical protein